MTTKLDNLVLVNQKIMNMIDNLQRGNFQIIMLDDGQPKDVTADNIKSLQMIEHMLESVIAQ